MRMAIIENIGHLIKYLTTSEDEKRDKRINSLFELLVTRFLDLNSYVRAKVFNVIIKLCECVHLSSNLPPCGLTFLVASLTSSPSAGSRSLSTLSGL